MQAIVSDLVAAKLANEAPIALRNLGEAKSPRTFDAVEKTIRALIATAAANPPRVAAVTFRNVAERWLSGALLDEYPETGIEPIKHRRIYACRGMLQRAIYPHIGDMPVTGITEQHCDAIKTAVKQRTRCGAASRRNYLLLVNQILDMAVTPMKLIEKNPLPSDWVPKLKKRRSAFQYLEPREEAALMRCESLPLPLRLLFGFVVRNGSRIGEALALQWGDISLMTGKCNLDATKTDAPRWWKLDDDVIRALSAFKPDGATNDDLVWPNTDDPGERIVKSYIAEQFRDALITAGVDRAELFKKTDNRRPIRVHDLRATFVTVALAMGWTEFDIMCRTGHQSSVQLQQYRRDVAELQKMGMTWFEPLDILLGLTVVPAPRRAAGATGVARGVAQHPKLTVINGGSESICSNSKALPGVVETHISREKLPREHAEVVSGPPQNGGVAQSALADLTAAIASATKAGKWALADRLTAALEGLRASEGVG
jgi:integrase